MTGGGVNWGSAAFDPVNQILYANTSRAVQIIKLIPRADAEGFKAPPGHDFGPQRGAPFAMTRALGASPLGMPCNKPPWGMMVAVDLKAGKILWQSSVGTVEDRAPLGIAFSFGTPLINGLVITAGGLAFTGAMDAYLRAFDAKSGAELWQGRLPVPGVANPMTYLWKGEQYVAIGAGGHSESGTTIGDSLVAFRLARPGEAPSLWSRTIDRPGGRFLAKAILFTLAVGLLAVAVWRWRPCQREAHSRIARAGGGEPIRAAPSKKTRRRPVHDVKDTHRRSSPNRNFSCRGYASPVLREESANSPCTGERQQRRQLKGLVESVEEAMLRMQDFEHHQHDRGRRHGTQRPRQQRKAAGNPAIPEGKRRRHDIGIGELEQAEADALDDQPCNTQSGRRLFGPCAQQHETGANPGGAGKGQPFGGHSLPDQAAADRCGQRRTGRARGQNGAALAKRIAGHAGQIIGHQQPDRKGCEIGEHADEVQYRKARQTKNREVDDRPRCAGLPQDEACEGQSGQQSEPDGGELANPVERHQHRHQAQRQSDAAGNVEGVACRARRRGRQAT